MYGAIILAAWYLGQSATGIITGGPIPKVPYGKTTNRIQTLSGNTADRIKAPTNPYVKD